MALSVRMSLSLGSCSSIPAAPGLPRGPFSCRTSTVLVEETAGQPGSFYSFNLGRKLGSSWGSEGSIFFLSKVVKYTLLPRQGF